MGRLLLVGVLVAGSLASRGELAGLEEENRRLAGLLEQASDMLDKVLDNVAASRRSCSGDSCSEPPKPGSPRSPRRRLSQDAKTFVHHSVPHSFDDAAACLSVEGSPGPLTIHDTAGTLSTIPTPLRATLEPRVLTDRLAD